MPPTGSSPAEEKRLLIGSGLRRKRGKRSPALLSARVITGGAEKGEELLGHVAHRREALCGGSD